LDHPVVVIGGGISGISAAVELAEAGRQVVLLEKEPYLGGKVARLNNYFPKLCPPACGLEINFRRIRSNPRISFHWGARVRAVSGDQGDYHLQVEKSPRLITEQCTACGQCLDACPEEPSAVFFQGGLSLPMKYNIDAERCKGKACGKCLEVCGYNAIDLESRPGTMELQASEIIVATGWEPYDARKIDQYGNGQDPDVMSNMEFEALLADCLEKDRNMTRPSDGKVPERIAFVQCAGSRDERHLSYCSAVCCAASVKHALTLAERYPAIHSEIFYIDLRLPGRNEALLTRASLTGQISLTKGKVGKVRREKEELILEVEDIAASKLRKQEADLVVLATGMVPNRSVEGLHRNADGFLTEEQQPGIVAAATSRSPMDVSTSVKDATAAAIKAWRMGHE
jgi:quinone-modifying oxidoreductase subunit QmoA